MDDPCALYLCSDSLCSCDLHNTPECAIFPDQMGEETQRNHRLDGRFRLHSTVEVNQ